MTGSKFQYEGFISHIFILPINFEICQKLKTSCELKIYF